VTDQRLADRELAWKRKPALRAIYTDIYARMAAHCLPGQTVEVGGGSSGFKEFAPRTIVTDVLFARWLDLVADAACLPFRPRTVANIVMFDVLHHIEFPRRFFEDAARILVPGGRIVMAEPAITVASWPFYRFFHPEPLSMQADPLASRSPSSARDPFDANQAIPTLLFGRDRQRFIATFPTLSIRSVTRLSLFAYPLSGGYRRWSLVPSSWVRPLLRIEDRLLPMVGSLMAFRMLVVIQCSGDPPPRSATAPPAVRVHSLPTAWVV